MPVLDLDSVITASGLTITTLPEIVNTIVSLLLPLSGVILLGIIIYAGFTMLTGAGDPKKVDQAKDILTKGIIGFLVIFASYWIAQILEVLFNFPIVTP